MIMKQDFINTRLEGQTEKDPFPEWLQSSHNNGEVRWYIERD